MYPPTICGLPELCCQQILSFLIRSMHFYLLGIFNARRDLMEILLVGNSYRENIKLQSPRATGCDLSHFLRDDNFSFFHFFSITCQIIIGSRPKFPCTIWVLFFLCPSTFLTKLYFNKISLLKLTTMNNQM
jgi:hypothetical protein